MIRKGKIEKIVNGGFGLIRSEDGIVLINYSIPGEKVKYRIKERAKGVIWGELTEIIEPDPKRVKPECIYFGKCGGCIFSHLEYEDQLKIKRGILKDDLKRIGKLDINCDRILRSPEYMYRSRARFKGLSNGKIGFVKKGTNEVMEINSCMIISPEINQFLNKWNSMDNMPFFHQIDLFFNNTNNLLYVHLSEHPGNGFKTISDNFKKTIFSWKGNEQFGESILKVDKYSYHVSPDTFFQVNRFQWENMLEIADSWMSETELSIDLYSGVGFFIPVLKKYSKKVIGVENSKRSVNLAKKNFKNTDLRRVPVEKFIFPDFNKIIIDPPRSGIPGNVLKDLIFSKPDTIINISCSTATLARDLKSFIDNGYKIEEMIMIDMFPQTAHMETMTLLKLK